jgi:excisionase family DNA binding protein
MRHDMPLAVGDEHAADPRSPELHELLTVDEVAAYLKVSKSWVYEHTRAREVGRGECLPHIRIGKYLRFDAQAVQVFLARRAHGR